MFVFPDPIFSIRNVEPPFSNNSYNQTDLFCQSYKNGSKTTFRFSFYPTYTNLFKSWRQLKTSLLYRSFFSVFLSSQMSVLYSVLPLSSVNTGVLWLIDHFWNLYLALRYITCLILFMSKCFLSSQYLCIVCLLAF